MSSSIARGFPSSRTTFRYWISTAALFSAICLAIMRIPSTISFASKPVITDGTFLEATRSVLNEYGGLWFYDESYVVSRRRR